MSNALYEYLNGKLVKGLCMDNDIATELKCMSDGDILCVINPALKTKPPSNWFTIYDPKDIIDKPDDAWEKQDNKTIKGTK